MRRWVEDRAVDVSEDDQKVLDEGRQEGGRRSWCGRMDMEEGKEERSREGSICRQEDGEAGAHALGRVFVVGEAETERVVMSKLIVVKWK